MKNISMLLKAKRSRQFLALSMLLSTGYVMQPAQASFGGGLESMQQDGTMSRQAAQASRIATEMGNPVTADSIQLFVNNVELEIASLTADSSREDIVNAMTALHDASTAFKQLSAEDQASNASIQTDLQQMKASVKALMPTKQGFGGNLLQQGQVSRQAAQASRIAAEMGNQVTADTISSFVSNVELEVAALTADSSREDLVKAMMAVHDASTAFKQLSAADQASNSSILTDLQQMKATLKALMPQKEAFAVAPLAAEVAPQEVAPQEVAQMPADALVQADSPVVSMTEAPVIDAGVVA